MTLSWNCFCKKSHRNKVKISYHIIWFICRNISLISLKITCKRVYLHLCSVVRVKSHRFVVHNIRERNRSLHTGKSLNFSFYSKLDTFMNNVSVFYEGQKNWRNLHRRFDIMYLVSVKSTVKISTFFVAFLENTNFNVLLSALGGPNKRVD